MGRGCYEEEEFETGAIVYVVCGACGGDGYIEYDRWRAI
jgi:hypothetical protein